MGGNRSAGYTVLRCTFILVILLAGSPVLAEEPAEKSVILFIHSYHPTYLWSSDITAGFLDTLGDPGPENRIAIEYLDWKNYQSEESLTLQEQLLRYKYGNQTIRLIVVADDRALQFILDRRKTLFPDVPVVYTGLNGYEELHPYTYANTTGIVTAINPKATLEAMISLFPDTTDIWIVCEDTDSGREIRHLIHKAAGNIPAAITCHDTGNITTAELYRRMGDLPPHTLILIGNWSRDSAGNVIDIGRFAEELAKVSPVPVFNLYDFNLGKGTVGGSIISGRHQGVLAARMAAEILNGTRADDIPVNLNDSTSYVFDALTLKRFGVPEERLPPGSTVINREPIILEQYYREVISAIIIIIILASSLLALLYVMHQRRKTGRLMQVFINTLPGFVFFKDTRGRYRIVNQRMLDTVGMTSRDFTGKTDADIFPPDLAEKYAEDDQRVITSKEPLYIPEEEIEIRHGVRVPHSTRKVPVTGEHGEVTGVIGLSVDISEQIATRKAVEESREKYYSLFELGWEAIFLVETHSGAILEANSAASDMYGYSHEELLGMTLSELSPEQDKPTAFLQDHPEGFFSIPVRNHVRRDGSRFPVEIVGRFFEWSNKKVGVAAIRDISGRIRDQEALRKATEKINLFNYLTRTTINNQLFILRGYLGLAADLAGEGETKDFIMQSRTILDSIERLMLFMKNYQDLGLKPAIWLNTREVFLYAVSHLDMTGITRNVDVPGLYIYADPFLEKVFEHLVENSLSHGGKVTTITLRYECSGEDLILWYEDDGTGIPDERKDSIFDLNIKEKRGIGLILVREILGITGISIREEGIYGSGARFLLRVPKGGFRFDTGDPVT
ncbi:MAG: PAS domain S-box protein [Methanospirillum sp.]|nr:PAS domain S-box protein [Methanospirillum sp.]